MFHFPIPLRPPVLGTAHPPLISLGNVFSEQELDRINDIALRIPEKEVRVGTVLEVNADFNRSAFRYIPPDQETLWIYQKLGEAASVMNAQVYKFDITGFDEMLYHLTYRAENAGHYDWHMDGTTPDKPVRKLALTTQLTDPAEYEGGDLEVNKTGDPVTGPRERGSVIMFPCYHVHRVMPVVRGTRRALTTWVVGPPFR